MSVRLMSWAFSLNLPDIEILLGDTVHTIKASTAKFVLLALADCANDHGHGAYPSLNKLASKTSMTRRTVQRSLDALLQMGIIKCSGKSEYGTDDYSIIEKSIYGGGFLAEGVTLVHMSDDSGTPGGDSGAEKVVPESPESLLKPSIEPSIKRENEKKSISGLPEPTGDQLGDWLKGSEALKMKHLAPTLVLETLSREFRFNFPKFGENQALDRVAKLIAKDGRDVVKFVIWAKSKKRDPYWYHMKPDNLWGDWPQAFETASGESPIRLELERAREEIKRNGHAN